MIADLRNWNRGKLRTNQIFTKDFSKAIEMGKTSFFWKDRWNERWKYRGLVEILFKEQSEAQIPSLSPCKWVTVSLPASRDAKAQIHIVGHTRPRSGRKLWAENRRRGRLREQMHTECWDLTHNTIHKSYSIPRRMPAETEKVLQASNKKQRHIFKLFKRKEVLRNAKFESRNEKFNRRFER